MNTEITDTPIKNPAQGWVFYDGTCALCLRLARRWERPLERRGFVLVPLQEDWVAKRLHLIPAELLREMRLQRTDGRLFGGADALLELARGFWWAQPLRWLAALPGVRPLLHRFYRAIAEHRHCTNGRCAIPRPNPLTPWLPLFLGTALVTFALAPAPAWLRMWGIAFAIGWGLKYATLVDAWRTGLRPNKLQMLAYWLGWCGLNVREFFGTNRPPRPAAREWLLALTKLVIGAALVWLAFPYLLTTHAFWAAWVGMVGLVLLLHFGCFHLVALAWQRVGVLARPIMLRPLAATSLGDFWGRRWNRAFTDTAHRYLFLLLHRRFSAATTTLIVFLVSGIVHDLVISVPARAGYGLPTLYFLIQGLAVLFEHGGWGRRMGLGHGACGWLFTVAVTLLPLPLLFHPPFIERVMLPFLQVPNP